MNYKNFLFPFFILFSFHNITAQEITPDTTNAAGNFLLSKKFISAAAVSGFYVGTLIDSYQTWWADNKRPFTFMTSEWIESDGDRGMNKFGHFYTSYLFYKVQKNVLLWGGYSTGTAQAVSGGLTMLMSLLIEVGDGFSRYGFDYKDFVFNTGGLTYSFLQDEIPFLNNFDIKFSYFPSMGYSFPPKFSDHYEGHIYWLTVNASGIYNYFTENSFPEYIQPAFGYSISRKLEPEYILGLDFNLKPLFNSDTPVINYIGDFINLFHIPAPGVKFCKGKSPEYRLFLLN